MIDPDRIGIPNDHRAATALPAPLHKVNGVFRIRWQVGEVERHLRVIAVFKACRRCPRGKIARLGVSGYGIVLLAQHLRRRYRKIIARQDDNPFSGRFG